MNFQITIPHKIISFIPANTESKARFVSEDNKNYFITIEAWAKVILTENSCEKIFGLILTDFGLYPADCLDYFEGYINFNPLEENPFLCKLKEPKD